MEEKYLITDASVEIVSAFEVLTEELEHAGTNTCRWRWAIMALYGGRWCSVSTRFGPRMQPDVGVFFLPVRVRIQAGLSTVFRRISCYLLILAIERRGGVPKGGSMQELQVPITARGNKHNGLHSSDRRLQNRRRGEDQRKLSDAPKSGAQPIGWTSDDSQRCIRSRVGNGDSLGCELKAVCF